MAAREAAFTPTASPGAPVHGPLGEQAGPDRMQAWLLPAGRPGVSMRAYLHRPQGDGPFPLAVVNHGSVQDPIGRARMAVPAYPHLTAWLLARGYAVLRPVRPGHGETGGPYLEDQGGCATADFAGAADATADAIQAATDFMAAQPGIARQGVVVIGNSAGGWGALALAARNPAGVRAIVNIAGGRGGRDRGRARNCAPDRLVAAAAAFGRTARVPSLWLYAANDSYFPPDLSGRLAAAYRDAGGIVDYRLLGPVGAEGHRLADAPPPAPWEAPLAAFLDGLR